MYYKFVTMSLLLKQAELLILRLSRNSGVLGLAGMAFVTQLFATHIKCFDENSGSSGILLVRPMLEFSKEDMYKVSIFILLKHCCFFFSVFSLLSYSLPTRNFHVCRHQTLN